MAGTQRGCCQTIEGQKRRGFVTLQLLSWLYRATTLKFLCFQSIRALLVADCHFSQASASARNSLGRWQTESGKNGPAVRFQPGLSPWCPCFPPNNPVFHVGMRARRDASAPITCSGFLRAWCDVCSFQLCVGHTCTGEFNDLFYCCLPSIFIYIN